MGRDTLESRWPVQDLELAEQGCLSGGRGQGGDTAWLFWPQSLDCKASTDGFTVVQGKHGWAFRGAGTA